MAATGFCPEVCCAFLPQRAVRRKSVIDLKHADMSQFVQSRVDDVRMRVIDIKQLSIQPNLPIAAAANGNARAAAAQIPGDL